MRRRQANDICLNCGRYCSGPCPHCTRKSAGGLRDRAPLNGPGKRFCDPEGNIWRVYEFGHTFVARIENEATGEKVEVPWQVIKSKKHGWRRLDGTTDA